MRLTRRQLSNMIKRQIMREYAKDYLSTSHPGGSGEERDPELDFSESELYEDSGEEEGEHYDVDAMSDDEHIDMIRRHLDALEKDKDYDKDHIKSESRRRRLRRTLSRY